MRTLTAALAAAALAAAAVTVVASGPVSARAESLREPVVFVHGYLGSAQTWDEARRQFQAAGYPEQSLFTYSYDSRGDVTAAAAGLQQFVDQVQADTGATHVAIVNHSLGGLVTRWYLNQLGGTADVDRVVSLAGANHGTAAADACRSVDVSCAQMMPESSLLRDLAFTADAPGPTAWATWSSPTDGVIQPYQSTSLNGAVNVIVEDRTHTEFPRDPEVLGQVITWLQR